MVQHCDRRGDNLKKEVNVCSSTLTVGGNADMSLIAVRSGLRMCEPISDGLDDKY